MIATPNWYTKTAGEESGPFTLSALIQKARNGEISPDSLVRNERNDWTRADRIRLLFKSDNPAPAQAGGYLYWVVLGIAGLMLVIAFVGRRPWQPDAAMPEQESKQVAVRKANSDDAQAPNAADSQANTHNEPISNAEEMCPLRHPSKRGLDVVEDSYAEQLCQRSILGRKASLQHQDDRDLRRDTIVAGASHRLLGGFAHSVERDLHARSMFTHILNHDGNTVFEADLPAGPDAFRDAIAPYRAGLVVGCECMFSWYWLADLCEDDEIPFTLGHALYMKAIHGGKAKNDRIDALHSGEWSVAGDELRKDRLVTRHSSLPQELADLLGLHVARRGFWDATFPNSQEGGDNAVGSWAWEHESAWAEPFA